MFTVRIASRQDSDQLADHRTCMYMSGEDGIKAPPYNDSLKYVKKLLGSPNKGKYLVAQDTDGTLAGSLLLIPDYQFGKLTWWISALYVRPSYRRQHVASALIEQVKTYAAAEKVKPAVKLMVDAGNKPALGVYFNAGFHLGWTLVMELQ